MSWELMGNNFWFDLDMDVNGHATRSYNPDLRWPQHEWWAR
jgi:hypothetical protein